MFSQTSVNVGFSPFSLKTETHVHPLNTKINDGNQQFPIHLVCSGQPQTINVLKQWILTITGPNYELRFCGNSGAGVGRQVTRWNRLIDAIFPILRTFHPSILFGIGSHIPIKTCLHAHNVLSPHLGAETTPIAKNTATMNGVCTGTHFGKCPKSKKEPVRQK